MGVSQVAATNRNAQATKTKTIGRFSVQATVQKPKERQFQVVPVPCVFTRGRWKCWDFKIGTDVTSTPDILEFADKTSVTEKTLQTPTVLKTTTPIIESTHPQTVFTHTVTTCDLTASASDQRLCERDYKESSTIVVTSIEPAPLTPVHSNKESRGSDCADSPDGRRIIMTSSPTKHKPTCTFHNAGDLSTSDSGDSYESYGRATAYSNTGNVSPPPHNMSPPPVQINNNYGASLSRQQSINGFGNHDPSCIISPSHDIAIDDSSIMPQNNVAIDNKIEQAMDLVKNHLTYAVREEVDNMRSHIVELEGRVNELDRQNQFLRQFAPPEVLANLPMLSQQRMLPTVIPHIPITQQIPGLTMHQQQPMQHAATVPSRNTGAIAPQVASSAGGSPKGNTDHQQPSMIPKLNRPSGIPLPNSFFESSGVRRSPEP